MAWQPSCCPHYKKALWPNDGRGKRRGSVGVPCQLQVRPLRVQKKLPKWLGRLEKGLSHLRANLF